MERREQIERDELTQRDDQTDREDLTERGEEDEGEEEEDERDGEEEEEIIEEEDERVRRGNLFFTDFENNDEINLLDNLHKGHVADCVSNIIKILRSPTEDFKSLLSSLFLILDENDPSLAILIRNFERIFEGLLINRMNYTREFEQPKPDLYAQADINLFFAGIINPPIADAANSVKRECKTRIFPIFFNANEMKQIEILVDEASHHFADTLDDEQSNFLNDVRSYGELAKLVGYDKD